MFRSGSGGGSAGGGAASSGGMSPSSPNRADVVVTDREAAAHFCFIRLCLSLKHSTRLAGLLSIVCNTTMLSYAWSTWIVSLRLYSSLLGLAVVLAECEWRAFFTLMPCLESWALRGGFLVFLGVLGQCALLLDVQPTLQQKPPPTFRFICRVSSWYLIGSGLVYFALGIFCFGRLKAWQLSKFKRKKLIKAEMQFLSAQKDEIERLLADTDAKLQML